ncbi:MAG: DNA primase [Bacteroidales bacterium]|jgi:DNA primase|nr:DNA primase [Bacteroidales bacterium]
MIDHLTVEKILDTAEIVDVIQDFVNLRRRGVNYMGLCPFHNEKTPSFTVSPSKGIFKCFGCGKGGNAVNFVMEHEHISYPEALRYLAKKYGIEVEERELSEEEKKLSTEKDSLAIVNSFAAGYFSNNLLNTDEGIEIGLSYFKERGFNEYIINEFQLGYSHEEKDAFTNQALKSGYKLEYIEKTGLTIIKDNYKIDRFAGRVMFPIFSLSGQIIGFGGRILKNDKKVAKYLNSPESSIYNKSKVLYGLFQAKQEIIKNDKCYLVEGYTDVLSLFMSGIKNVVASSGTSLTQDQTRLIHRFTENVTILYDGDAAGIKASLRGIDILLEEGLNVRILLFPENEDPDSFSRKNGSSVTIDYINSNEEDFIRFKTRLLNEEAKNDPIKRSALITDIVKSIAVISNNIKQSVYIQECSRILDIDENVLYSEVAKIKRRKYEEAKKQEYKSVVPVNTKTIPPVPSYIDKVYYEAQEYEIIRLLLLYGNKVISEYIDTVTSEKRPVTVAAYIIDQLRNDQLEMKNIMNQKIFSLAEEVLNSGNQIVTEYFTKHPDPEISMLSANICSSRDQLSPLWEKRGSPLLKEDKKLPEILEDLFIKYKLNIVKEGKKDLTERLKKAKADLNEDEIEELIKKIANTNEIIKKLSYIQSRVIL